MPNRSLSPRTRASHAVSSATKYLGDALSSIFISKPQNAKSFDSPLFDGDNHAVARPHMNLSMRLTSDIVASSVRSSLRQFNPTNPTKSDCRVLIMGSHAKSRALYLAASKDFPSDVYPLKFDKPQEHGGIFYLDGGDITGLHGATCPRFDSICAFNVAIDALVAPESIRAITGLVRASGTFAGTGLFQKASEEVEGDDLTLPCSLLSFRERSEAQGFFMHTCVDLALEGSLVAHVIEDARVISLLDVEWFEAGRLCTGRFLATKAPYRKPRLMLSINPRAPPLEEAIVPAGSTYAMKPMDAVSPSSASYPYELASPYSASTSRLMSPTSARGYTRCEPIVISGVSLGLPNGNSPVRKVFDADNFAAIFRGDNFISLLTQNDKQRILNQNVCQVYKKDGKRIKHRLSEDREVIQVAAKIVGFDLKRDFPAIPSHVAEVLDTTFALAIAAGLEALKDAGLDVISVNPESGEHSIIGLPESMRDDTGVIFASSFPSLDSMTEEVTKSASAKARQQPDEYEYDRKLLFKLLVMANSQLAELIKARGPNTHINNACSGTTQAISLAEDWIRVGRAKRVIVISADHATSEHLFPYLATGFLALGAASILPSVEEASAPFDARRKGMILGAGAVGLVIEASTAVSGRGAQAQAELLGSCISNSAFHASLMDNKTTSVALRRFMTRMEEEHGLSRASLAKELIYFAHETGTHANGGCAKVELDALHATFGADANHILMANTKGFTGHPMGVGIEDVVAVRSLFANALPPIANHKVSDPCLKLLPEQLPLLPGSHDRHYVLRFAAGFGSQFAYVLYRTADWSQSNDLDRTAENSLVAIGSSHGAASPWHMNSPRAISMGATANVPMM